MQESLSAIQDRNAELWVISIDPADKLEAMKKDMGLTFPHLMDPGSKVIRSFGLLNEQHGELPHPATLVLDADGVVRFLEINVNFRERPATAKVIEALQGLAPAS